MGHVLHLYLPAASTSCSSENLDVKVSPRFTKPCKRSHDIHTAVGDTVLFFAVLLPLLFLILSILGAECKQPQLPLQTCILMKRCVLRGDVNPLFSQPDNSVWRRQQRAGDWKEAYTLTPKTQVCVCRKVSDTTPTSYTSFTCVKLLFLPIFGHQA